MTKKIIALLLAVCLIFTLSSAALAAEDIRVCIDGSSVAFNNDTGRPFIDANGRTLVPLRVTMETYGCEVFWDNENNNAIVYKDGVTVVCPIGENHIVINGKTVTVDTAAVVAGGRTYLPIRCVLEAVGATMCWDNATQTVLVTRGETAVLPQQDEYIALAMDAIEANTYLSEQYASDVKKAVTLYLQNVPVDEAQISKMCARLKLLKFVEGALSEEEGGLCYTKDNINYTITVDTVNEGKIRNSQVYDCIVFHELCHMFSNINQTSKWFQEGMTTIFEMDIAGKETMDLTSYDAYYRVIFILTELLGKDMMREAYLTGNESPIYTKFNEYAGVTNSATVIKTNVEKMTEALIGGVFTWMNKADGKTKEQWQQQYDEAALILSQLFEKAYTGKHGSAVSDNPLLSTYLAWLQDFNFLGTTIIMSDPTVVYGTKINYYGPKNYRSFILINNKSGAYCRDGELVYYRY